MLRPWQSLLDTMRLSAPARQGRTGSIGSDLSPIARRVRGLGTRCEPNHNPDVHSAHECSGRSRSANAGCGGAGAPLSRRLASTLCDSHEPNAPGVTIEARDAPSFLGELTQGRAGFEDVLMTADRVLPGGSTAREFAVAEPFHVLAALNASILSHAQRLGASTALTGRALSTLLSLQALVRHELTSSVVTLALVGVEAETRATAAAFEAHIEERDPALFERWSRDRRLLGMFERGIAQRAEALGGGRARRKRQCRSPSSQGRSARAWAGPRLQAFGLDQAERLAMVAPRVERRLQEDEFLAALAEQAPRRSSRGARSRNSRTRAYSPASNAVSASSRGRSIRRWIRSVGMTPAMITVRQLPERRTSERAATVTVTARALPAEAVWCA